MPQVIIPDPLTDERKLQLMVQRYEDLTATEIVGNVQWFRLSSAGQLNEAFRVLQVALDCEHFIAVLPLDPKEATPGMVDELKDLRDQLTAISGQYVRLNFLSETTGETSRTRSRAALENALNGNASI